MLRLVRFLLGVTLAGAILQADVTPAAAARVGCDGNVLVIGARGSAEAARPATLNMGPTLYAVYQQLADIPLQGASFQPLGLEYPAQDVPSAVATAGALYKSSYAVGKSRLRAELEQHAVACREQRFVLLGYSQGAHVVGDVVAELDPARPFDREILARIAGVALFGDPRYNREDDRVDVGGKRLNGVFDQWPLAISPTSRELVGRRAAYQDPPASRVRSYCLTGDLICNWSTSNALGCLGVAWVPLLGTVPSIRPTCPHLHYPDQVGYKAVAFLARQVRQALLGPPRVATTALPPATIGTAYRQNLVVTGGRAPYVWSMAGGRLPSGLALTPSGAVDGTPTQAEVRSFQVRVRDANWRTATSRLTLVVQSSVPAATDGWPQVGGNPAHDGFNPSVSAINRSSAPSLSERWATDISGPTLGGADASPVVAGGRVYLQVPHSPTTDGAALLAMDAATGATIWSQPLPSPSTAASMVSTAAVANGVVAVGDGQQLVDGAVHGSVRAFDAATGDPLWTVPAGYSAPPVAADGATFYAASDYQLQALDAVSHQPRWTTDLPGFVAAPPAVANGLVLTLVVVSNNGQLVAVDQITGQQRWTTGLGPAADFEQPPVAAGGLVYVTDSQNGSQPAAVAAYELDTGKQRWIRRLDMSDFGLDVSTPAVADGTVLVGDEDGNLYAFDAATGQLRYKHSDPEGALAFAGGFAITGGVLVTSDADATVRVLDVQDGAELWRQDISETNAYGPPAVAAGRIYVASFTRLHAYAIPGMNLPPSSGHLGAGMARHQSSRWGATFPTRRG